LALIDAAFDKISPMRAYIVASRVACRVIEMRAHGSSAFGEKIGNRGTLALTHLSAKRAASG
jgi:hypothetical protein